MARAPEPKDDQAVKLVAENRKARYDYEILSTHEAGIALTGTEVKTLRGGNVSLDEAYGRIDGEELFLVGAYIEEYTHGNRQNHEPTRKRKLLLHKRELKKLVDKVQQQGLTLAPLRLYFRGSWAKLELGLVKGRRKGDKRQVSKAKDARREIDSYR